MMFICYAEHRLGTCMSMHGHVSQVDLNSTIDVLATYLLSILCDLKLV